MTMCKLALSSALWLAVFATSVWSQTTVVDDLTPVEAAAPESLPRDKSAELFDPSPALKGIEEAIRDLIEEEDKLEQERIRDQDARDLKAQEGMALWAKWMFWATAATALLTAAALYTIVRTLHYTRLAADHSKEMVREAKLATEAAVLTSKAAQYANEIAHRASDLETRAYLVADNVVLYTYGHDNTVFVSVRLRNVGKTPAYNIIAVRLAMSVDSQKISRDPSGLPDGNIEFPMIATLVPGGTENQQFPVFLDQTFDSSLISTPGAIVKHIEAMIVYQTISDRAAKCFSGELSLYVEIDKDVLELAKLELGATVESSSAAHRSGWMDCYLQLMKERYDQHMLRSYGGGGDI